MISVHRYAQRMQTFIKVAGIPTPKGSLRHVGNGRLVEQTKVKPWMSAIRGAAGAAIHDRQIDVPVAIGIEFYFPRPKAAKNRLYPHMRSVGDIDKLCRAVLDGLQPTKTEHGPLLDDSLVVDLWAKKRYTVDGWVGALIQIDELI